MQSILSEKRYTQEASAASAEVSKAVAERHVKWLVSHKFLVDQNDVDQIMSSQADYCDETILREGERVTERQRLLLEVERKKVVERQIEAKVKEARVKQISAHVQRVAKAIMEKRFKELDVRRITGVHEGFAHFASFAYSPTLNFNKLGGMTLVHNSLNNAVMDLVENPKFCEQVGKTPKMIKDGKTAVGFIGIENCRMIFPVLMSKPLLRWADDNTKLMVPKMWQHAITMALTARERLIDAGYKEPDEGVLLGMLRGIANFAIANHFTSCFDEALIHVMQEFRNKEMRDEYYACADIKPNMAFLPDFIMKNEKELTIKIVESLDWDQRTLHLKNAIIEDAQDVPMLDRSVHGTALGQARAFSVYKSMTKSAAFVTKHKPYWAAHHMLDGEIIKTLSAKETAKFQFQS